ncbi:hypothetical protein BBJ29_003836 [Phytophthora kernoviae]|uniref:L-type lectin-like domain-containing protein n=1 Tax=Phytophthora kernoviae TaxID=325452 RepID=A0A3F2RHB2_9STRA|nr:hypothetical protein BBJ29_003836 [Phytophthora kernoviae]RLN56995.1 hypothetical protein BBP00_00007724 [Phytophthora kernoviae]
MKACGLLLLILTAGVALMMHCITAAKIEDISFKPPFELVDAEGRRMINTTWSHGGNADVKKHFIRLTTDRQSKRGHLWQKNTVDRDELSAILTFRVSGQGKRWFGDGLGLWLTGQKVFTPGVNHGFTDKYKGVGVVIDTFNNPEHKGGHKDVSIFVNDGTKTYDQMHEEKREGCNAAVRYHEQSANFDPVHSISRVKVKISKNRLAVEVDEHSSGLWVACHEMTLPFSEDWLRESTIGITASTGALADNHDIIRFDAYTDFTDSTTGAVDSEMVMNSVSKDYKKWMDSPNCGTDCLIAVLQKELSNFRIDAEHRFSDLKEKTENTVAKLKKNEGENERRVREIEAKVRKGIDSSLEKTKTQLGAEMNDKISKQLEENPDIASGGWKTPFALLFIVIAGGAVFVYRKYQSLMKSHLFMFGRLVTLASAAALSALMASVSGSVVPALTFKQPYEVVDSYGHRQISDGIMYGGHTEVKKNFIRLTPDRQSKRGHIWSKSTIDKDELVTVVTYRIHGQGKKWFGDGIGLWFTQEPTWKNGDNHGFTDKYLGFGILLDTFHNVEHRGGHKDVTIQVNDGQKRLDDLNDENKIGCEAAFRYHSNSANFDPVYSSSRVRIKVKGNALEVEVDATNTGVWVECYKGNLPFANDWLKRATFGVSASTGALADNHDILRVQSFDQIDDAALGIVDAETWTHNYSKDFMQLMESSVCDQTCKVTILEKYVTNFQVETEHWFEMLREQTENTIGKLKEKERQNQRKIQALTDRMTDMMEQKIGQKMADVRSKVNEKIATEVEGELTVARSSWRLPFFVLLILIAGGVGVAYQKYRKLVKSHLY